jgi:hypothetical protein
LQIFFASHNNYLDFFKPAESNLSVWPCDREAAMGKQLHRSNGVEVPGVKQALDKAEEYTKLASTAQTLEERDHCDRMSRKWFGIADGWRAIAEFDQA